MQRKQNYTTYIKVGKILREKIKIIVSHEDIYNAFSVKFQNRQDI